jgi:hypothetical protein
MTASSWWWRCVVVLLAAAVSGQARRAGSAGAKSVAEISKLRAVLLEPREKEYGLEVPRDDEQLKAIQRLEALASVQAVEALREFLTSPRGNRKLKIHALVALSRTGTKEAVAAIEAFEKWAEARRTKPPPFRFGLYDHAITHFAPHRLKPAAEAVGARGRKQAVFWWYRFGRRRLWLTEQAGKDTWTDPVLVPIDVPVQAGRPAPQVQLKTRGGKFLVVIGGQEHNFELKDALADADKDGLSNGVEEMLGTDPSKKDTDGDGEPDRADPCPLTPKPKKTDEVFQIRQAVMTILFATCHNRDVIMLADRREPATEFARQQFRGFAGYMIPSPLRRAGMVHVMGLDVKMASPTSATASIHDWEARSAASSHRAELRKIHGRWVVVSFRMTVIA